MRQLIDVFLSFVGSRSFRVAQYDKLQLLIFRERERAGRSSSIGVGHDCPYAIRYALLLDQLEEVLNERQSSND